MNKISISKLAAIFGAYLNSVAEANSHWALKHRDKMNEMFERLPHGSGFDMGTMFDYDNSTRDKLIFTTEFHHMDQNGGYIKWTKHKIIVTPSLQFGYLLEITGPNFLDVKSYIQDVFRNIFTYL